MISAKEKRFLKYWEDQKMGGKRQYIIVYTIGWSLVIFFIPLAVSFFINMYTAFRLYQLPLWAAILLSIMISLAGSFYFWDRNEKRSKMIREREKLEKIY